VAREWEDEFFGDSLGSTRRVALRMAIVLGDGPATRTLVRLARIGLGGPQHDGWWFPHRRYRGIGRHPTGDGRAPRHRSRGRQRFSWIPLDDVVGAVRLVRDDAGISGPVNLAAPGTSDNRELMATLRRVVGAPIGLPAWRFMLEPAMWVLRTEPELVLKSRWAAPETLTGAGYQFTYPELEPALRDVVQSLGGRRH
jgi:NAD dependent epimerase/dehydratase family enzyme